MSAKAPLILTQLEGVQVGRAVPILNFKKGFSLKVSETQHAIDKNPTVLLEWRGCMTGVEPVLAAVEPPTADRWEAGPLPELDEPRALPVGSVLKRLGPSGLVIDGVDLRDALEPAYVAFASRLQR